MICDRQFNCKFIRSLSECRPQSGKRVFTMFFWSEFLRESQYENKQLHNCTFFTLHTAHTHTYNELSCAVCCSFFSLLFIRCIQLPPQNRRTVSNGQTMQSLQLNTTYCYLIKLPSPFSEIHNNKQQKILLKMNFRRKL